MTAKNASRNRPRDSRKREAAVPYMAGAVSNVPPDAPMLTCRCGGRYRDHPDSRAAHQAVFGHRPIEVPPQPNEGRGGGSGSSTSAGNPTPGGAGWTG